MRRIPAPVRLPLEAGALGLLVGLAVVAPWIAGSARGEFLLLTDWVSGPTSTISAGMYGLADEALDAMPWRIAIQVLRDTVGPEHAAWLLVLLPFPVAAAGAAHLVRGGRLSAYSAALVVCCSPLVVDRIAVGHVPFLVGIATLPWLVASARHARSQNRWFSARTTGWLALSVSISPHMAWVGGMALLLVAVVPKPTWRDLARLTLVVLAAAGVYAYAIAVLLAGVPSMSVGRADLAAFATRSDAAGGLLVSALTLRGFWRDSADRVATDLGPWAAPFALLILAVVVLGIVTLVRSRTTRGPLAVAFIIVGALLSMGADGPIGPVYQLAFEHVPLFEAMREPQKWSALTQLGIAIAMAGAVQGLVERTTRPRLSRAGAIAVTALPLALLPSLAWGVGGTITTSAYPEGWRAADATLSNELTLVLPWHGYQPYSFTGGRSVATPGAAFLSPPVLTSAAVEVGPLRTNSTSERQRFLDGLIAEGGGASFADDLALLGVRQVAVARNAAPDEDYSWLDGQAGLRKVLSTPTMDVYRVLSPTPGGERVRAAGPVAFQIAAGTPGTVVIPVECSEGWRLDGQPGTCTRAGTLAFEVGSGAARVDYAPWALIKPGLLVSLAMLALLVGAGLVEHAADLRRRR